MITPRPHLMSLRKALLIGILASIPLAGLSAPAITGVESDPLETNDKETTNVPFDGVTISHTDDDEILEVVVTITPAINGSFSNAGDFDDDGNGIYTFSGTAAEATAKVAALNFVPVENRITAGTSDNTAVAISVEDTDDLTATASRDITILSVNDPPVIIAGANVNMNDNATAAIFSNVSIEDPDFEDTVTITITFDSEKGSFSNTTGFTLGGSGASTTLTLNPARLVADAETAIQGLIFTPVENRVAVDDTEDATFEIVVDDGDDTDDDTLTVVILSINDSPVLAPPTPLSFSVSSGSTIIPFANITLTDEDFDDTTPDPTDLTAPAGDPFTATIVLAPSPFGSIVSASFTSTTPGIFTYEGTRLQVQAAIQAARYLAPGETGTYTISLSVKDSSNKPNDTSNTVVATATVQSPTPGMSGLISGQQLLDNATISPFASASFNNFGGFDRLVEITLDSDAKGEFDILAGFTKSAAPAPFTYSLTDSSVAATDAIRALRFRPAANRIVGAEEFVTFTIVVKPEGGGTALSTDTLAVKVIPFNDAPTITGPAAEIRINDDETATPFSALTVADVDEGGNQTVVVSITLMGENPATNAPLAGGGTLAPVPGAPAVPGTTFTTVGTAPNLTWNISGAPAAVTTFLRALVFTPDPNRNAIGERETISFTIIANDNKGGTAQNQSIRVVVTAVNGAPIISGIPPLSLQPFPVPASGNNMTMPFAGLTVTDDESITFNIILDDPAKGALSTDDFTDDGGGSYSFAGTPAEVTAALQAMTYTIDPAFAFPLDQPGLTTFTFTAQDSINTTVRNFTIFIRERNVAHIVTSTADDGVGTLREAIGIAGNGDMIVFDFPADDFPVTLALESTLVVSKNLTIVGSGVRELTISGQGITGIFTVTNGARLTLEQLTLAHGAAPSYGGAVAVQPGGAIIARYCVFSGNRAGQFGGAIDVFEGEMTIENCLFVGNFVSGSVAKAGGAISIFSEGNSSLINTTFVNNRQENGGGLGGGAIYAENANLAAQFNLHIDHCTFLDNDDARRLGSAVHSASAGARVHVRNNIFADEDGQVLDVVGGGTFISHGGNIATDATVTTFTVNAQNITLLSHVSDRRSTNPQIGPLADNSGTTRTCLPLPGSPAIGTAIAYSPVSSGPGTDQRGYWRGNLPRDVGAVQTQTFKRFNINEIQTSSGAGVDFIEFYNPRDSDVIDMNGIQLWIDGSLAHTFATLTLIPGEGFAWTSTVDLDPEKGVVELRDPAGKHILLVDYVADFAENGVELDTTGQSINRYPRYEGGFLPHQRVVENITGIPGGDLSSPGDDVDGSPLGGGNAPPIAVADVDDSLGTIFQVFADETLRPDLLANDIEFDRTDTLRITEVMALDAGTAINAELLGINGTGTIALTNLPPGLHTTITPLGSTVTIDADGRGITYDPTTLPVMIGLAQGETITDIWAYTIRDFDESNTPQSRGADPAKQEENIIKATAYFTITITGVNEAPEPRDDSAATFENQAIRLLADPDLLDPAPFNFGDLPANFQDFDASGNPVTLLPPPPDVALLTNDIDVDSDDDSSTLLLAAVHTTAVPADTLVTTSALGAAVVLDIRATRRETSIIYDPRPSAILNALSDGEILEDTFHYSVFDRHGARGVAKVTITVTGVNDVPMARDVGGFIANQNATLDIPGADLLANDTDPDGSDILTIATPFAATSTLGAVLAFDGTTIIYDPTGLPTFTSLARNETITDTFTYTATDSNGGTSTATVTLTVEGRNDAPVAADDLLEILENDTAHISAAAGLLSNDVDVDINGTDPDDVPWVIPQRGVITPMGAALDIHPDGSFRYDANSPAIDSLKEGELAVEIFPYTVIDNFRTQAADDHFRVFANSSQVNLPVLLNDAVVGTTPSPVLSYSDDEGNLVIESTDHSLRDGLLIRLEGYEGDGGYNGVHPVTAIDRDHFSIPIPFIDDPAATRGAWIPWFAITHISPGSQGGQLASGSAQSITYTPPSGFFGTETFTYTIQDGVGGQDVATVRVEVVLPRFNGFLSASDDRFRIGMGREQVVCDVLANDGILPGGPAGLTISAVEAIGSATGTATIVNGGLQLAYTPPDNTFTGAESFRYTISGGGTATAQAIVTFDVVNLTNRLDGAEDDFFVIIGSSGNLLPVLANDPVLPAYPVTTSLVAVNGSASGGTTGSGGTVAILDNQVSYTPPAAILTDTFTYTARDASGATVTRTVRVRVVPNVVEFFAINDTYTVVAGTGPVVLPVLNNDGTVLNPTATLSVVNLGLDTNAPPDVSRVAILNGNSVQYTPPPGATTEVFTYEISIGTLARRQATITVNVIDEFATSPKAEPDFYHVAKNSGPHILNVRLNDVPHPVAGWDWEIFARGTPSNGGSASIVNGGTAISYTPAPGFFGVESFSYAIRDVHGKSSAATVTVRVGDMLTAPDHFAVLQDGPAVAMPVLANDDLLEAFAADYTISAVTPDSAEGGTVSILGTGPANVVLYAPPAGFAGEDSFTYTVIDKSGGLHSEDVHITVIAANADRDHAELRVEITGVNDVPILVGTANATITDKETVHPFGNITITDLDEAGNQLQTVTISFDATYGSVSAPGMSQLSPGVFRATGTPAQVTAILRDVLFTPFENLIDYIDPGQFALAFHLSIDDGYVPDPVAGLAVITIIPVNDAPFIIMPIPDRVLHVNSMPTVVNLLFHFADVDDDVPGGQLTWSATTTNPALFASVSTDQSAHQLILEYAPDQPGIVDVTVRGTDRGGLFAETTFRIIVEGPPVIVLRPGEETLPPARLITANDDFVTRLYRDSFRIANQGTLPFSSFIVRVSNLNIPIPGTFVEAASYTINESGTPDIYGDDTRSSDGVAIVAISPGVFEVKYDRPLPPGGNLIVHLFYRVPDRSTDLEIRPDIRILPTTVSPTVVGEQQTTISMSQADGAIISIHVPAGKSYLMQYSANLSDWHDTPVRIPSSAFPRVVQIVDDGSATGVHPSESSQRFYRMAEIPAP